MKPVLMFILPTCPHCINAFALLDELKAANPAYAEVAVEVVDESAEPDRAERYDYYYVPTFYVGGVKRHEGVPTREAVEAVLRDAVS